MKKSKQPSAIPLNELIAHEARKVAVWSEIKPKSSENHEKLFRQLGPRLNCEWSWPIM